MSGIEGKKGYYLQKTGARVNELLERHYIVPTFTTSPTEDTLSWDDDGHIVYFRVGEIIRVKTPEGYDFYRVNDIKDDRINWVKIDTLSDTYTKGEIDVKFFTKEDASGYISEKLVNYYSKREVDGKIEQTNKSVLEQTERVDNLGVELKNKASAEQVNKLESGLETTKRSIAEQTTKVTALQSEIKTKASTQSVTQLGDNVNIIRDTVAEQTIRTDELEASIETKVSQETFDAATGDINSEFIAVKQTADAIETAVKSQSGEITAISESVNGLSISLGTIESELDSLRNQMDGTTESYFEKWIPTNENEPAKTWIEEGKEEEHKGDTFTNTSLDGEGAGKSWRWLQDDNGNWGWQPIADTDALKALEAAAKAQAAADGKVTIYYEQPSNYKKGDIWFVHNNSYSSYKQGEILSAKTENTVFSLSDWESKTRYTQAVEDLNDVMTTTFKDGVLTEAERISIVESITSIVNEQAAVQARYNIIIINANLTDETLKNEFKATKVAYDTVCTSLINIVEQIADAKTENLESLFDSYTQLSDDYSEAYAAHNEKESEINNALMGRLNPANVYIDNITDDGILTPIEKEQLFEIYRNIAKEYDATRSNALNYKVWKYSNNGVTEEPGLNGGEGRYNNYIAFKGAYNNVASVFGSSVWGFTNMKESTTLPNGYSTTMLKGYLNTYYEAYGNLTKSFSSITAAIEAAQKATETTLKGLTDNLLPEEQITTIGKGVVLSTIIATKDSSGKVTAGMNASSAHSDSTHGRVVFVGGAKDLNDFNKAPFVVYEDGHVNMSSATIGQYASKTEVEKSIEGVEELANTAKTTADNAQGLAGEAIEKANEAQSVVSDIEYLSQTFGPLALDVDGVVMSKMVAVKNKQNEVEAFLNGSEEAQDSEHGKLLLAGGIPNGEGTLSERAAEANTRIYEDGCAFTKKMHLDGGCTIGDDLEIVAVKTQIEGGNTEESDDDVFKNKCYIQAKDFDNNFLGASFSSDGISVIGQSIHSKRWQSVNINNGCAGRCIGVRIDKTTSKIPGADCIRYDKPVGIDIYAPDAYGILARSGMFAGLRPNVRVITTNTSTVDRTLTDFDHTIIINISSGTVTIKTPSDPQDGQEYEIYTCHAPMDLVIDFNGKTAYNFNDAANISRDTFTTDARRYIKLVYAGGQWWETYTYL